MTKLRFLSWRTVGGFAALVVVGLHIALALVGAVLRLNEPTGRDAAEAAAICDAVDDASLLPSGASALWYPGRRRSTIVVDGVRDAATQDRIVEVVRAARERRRAKPVVIEFRAVPTTQAARAEPDAPVVDEDDLLRTVTVE